MSLSYWHQMTKEKARQKKIDTVEMAWHTLKTVLCTSRKSWWFQGNQKRSEIRFSFTHTSPFLPVLWHTKWRGWYIHCLLWHNWEPGPFLGLPWVKYITHGRYTFMCILCCSSQCRGEPQSRHRINLDIWLEYENSTYSNIVTLLIWPQTYD